MQSSHISERELPLEVLLFSAILITCIFQAVTDMPDHLVELLQTAENVPAVSIFLGSVKNFYLIFLVLDYNGGVWETGPPDGASEAYYPNQNVYQIHFCTVLCILWFYEYIQRLQ